MYPFAIGAIRSRYIKSCNDFIEQEEGPDIFVNFSSINMSGFKKLAAGDQASFDIEDGDRGPVAQNDLKIWLAGSYLENLGIAISKPHENT